MTGTRHAMRALNFSSLEGMCAHAVGAMTVTLTEKCACVCVCVFLCCHAGDWTDGASQLLHLSTTTPHRPTPTHTGHDQGPPTNTLPLPHDPAAVASMRRAARRAALCLPRSEPTGVSAALQEPVQAASDTCPVLLVHRRHEDMPVWSLIVPRGWVMPFWLKLMHTGTHSSIAHTRTQIRSLYIGLGRAWRAVFRHVEWSCEAMVV